MKNFAKRTFFSLRIRNYRFYFAGQAISMCGTWMQILGQDWLVLNLTGSGTQLGVVSAFQFLPVLFLSPLGGIVADRFNKRRILCFTQCAFAAFALAMGVLVLTGTIRIWMIYVIAGLWGFVNAVDSPTRQTFIPEIVGTDHLRNAVALNATEFNIARAVGPVIGAAIIAGVGIGYCFILNSLSYIAVLGALALMRASELHHTERAKRAKGQLREGLRYLRSSRTTKNILIMIAIIGTLSYEFSVTLPLLAKFTFQGNASSYAALTGALGAGAIIGGLFAAGRRTVAGSMLVGSALCLGIAMLIVSATPTLALATLFMVLVGVSATSFNSLASTTLQLESPPEMRGRVMSLWSMAILGSTPLGGPTVGWIGQHMGPRWGLVIGGAAAILAAILGALTFLRADRLRKVPPQMQVASTGATAKEDFKSG